MSLIFPECAKLSESARVFPNVYECRRVLSSMCALCSVSDFVRVSSTVCEFGWMCPSVTEFAQVFLSVFECVRVCPLVVRVLMSVENTF